MSKEGHVNFVINDQIGEISFFHPAHNAMPGHLLGALANTIEKAGNDPAVKVIVLKSEGDRTFCAGASFNELVAIDNMEVGKKFFMGFANVINACRKCPKIIIGRVQGKAVGGGVGLAAAVDYCFATKYASVKLSELNIGIGPFVIGPAVERKIGISFFTQMAIDANTFYDAAWAHQRGLYHQVFDEISAMDAAVFTLATYLTTVSQEAQEKIKAISWENCTHWDELLEERASISGKLVTSATTKSILEKYKVSE